MININNSVVDLLHCQRQTKYDTACALQAIQQVQRDHTNDSFIYDIPTSDCILIGF